MNVCKEDTIKWSFVKKKRSFCEKADFKRNAVRYKNTAFKIQMSPTHVDAFRPPQPRQIWNLGCEHEVKIKCNNTGYLLWQSISDHSCQ